VKREILQRRAGGHRKLEDEKGGGREEEGWGRGGREGREGEPGMGEAEGG